MEVFAQRRDRLVQQIVPNGVVLLACKPEYVRNGDVEYEYRQESNFYYLSGFEEPESILLLNPSASQYKYVMFVRRKNPQAETWEGDRAGIEGATTTFKADTALAFPDFQRTVMSFVPAGGTLYYAFGTNPAIDERVRLLFGENAAWRIQNVTPLLAEMRLIKNEGDWRMGFARAIEISAQAHIEAFKAIAPGMYEYEVQAVFEYVYRKNGSPRNGYPCIVGSGPNSGILHYNANSRQMKSGDVVLMDCGAEYGCYSADVTRTVPVDGKFTREQREIYQLVLDAQNAAIAMVRPGVVKNVLDSAITDVLGTGLVRLGFLKDKRDSRIFTLHGYSHWLGLDVHDVGKATVDGKPRRLAEGMVFTIEPGIYIRPDVVDKMKDLNYSDEDIAAIQDRLGPYMHIGIRIEDDILVTETGYRNLSEAAPREIDAIELLMKH
jgi:Xaa-Pro aminopeptidase